MMLLFEFRCLVSLLVIPVASVLVPGRMFAQTSTDTHSKDVSSQSFSLEDVRLLPGPFQQAMKSAKRFLLSLDADRLLVGYRENANLEPRGERYGGWESRGLAGQTLGHYLSGLAFMHAASGEEVFAQRLDYCLQELADCQAASETGFLGGMPEGPRMFAEIAAGDLRVNGGFDLNGGWVPWYNQHKLFAGLRDAYRHAPSPESAELARQLYARLGDWAITVCEKLSPVQMQQMLIVEHGGMLETLADLYAITDDAKYLDLAKRFRHAAVFDPLAAGEDKLAGLHANTTIPKIIGVARLYELTGETRYREIAETFWHTVTQRRSFVTGSNSDREHFFPLGIEAGRLGTENGETCNVYNMLKLTRHLAAWDDDPQQQASRYDFYELALVNHILGSIDPASGGTTYFQPLQAGHFKVYCNNTDAFWCCTGTGLESHALYGRDIFTRSTDGQSLSVNLFVASELNWKEKGLKLVQKTDSRLMTQCSYL